MEIEDGIIVNGKFHKKVMELNISCPQCSLKSYCDVVDNNYDVWLCTVHNCFGFANCGKVTELKAEKNR